MVNMPDPRDFYRLSRSGKGVRDEWHSDFA
jgi:hypothetical protein